MRDDLKMKESVKIDIFHSVEHLAVITLNLTENT